MNTNSLRRRLAVLSVTALAACSAGPREPDLAGWSPAQREVHRACREAVASSRHVQAAHDRRKARETGAAVGGAYAKGALGTWDPSLQIASLGLGAAYGGAAALADGALRGARRHGDAQDALRGCLARGGPASAAAANDGSFQPRTLGAERGQ